MKYHETTVRCVKAWRANNLDKFEVMRLRAYAKVAAWRAVSREFRKILL